MIETHRGKEIECGLHTLQDQILDALLKDGGEYGDVTSQALIEAETTAQAEMITKADAGIVSGVGIAELVFKTVDPQITFIPLLRDGQSVKKGDVIALVEGNARNILKAERIALEFIRRMSGIATKTSLFVTQASESGVTILDTRKILPGYGDLDKQAVRDGGGTNHRANLSEMGLIKNNHIDVLNGNIELAVQKFREKYPNIPLEVEVRNEAELISALTSNPDRILLDNMSNPDTLKAVYVRNKYFQSTGIYIPLEASGDMRLERISEVADTGVDYISVGELTHSVKAFDISLHITFNQ